MQAPQSFRRFQPAPPAPCARRPLLLLMSVSGAASAASPLDAAPVAPEVSYDPKKADQPITVRLGDGVCFKPYYLTDLELGSYLSDADVRGGRQQTWTVRASWWPVLPLRLIAEYLHADVSGGPSPRTANALAGRLVIQF